MSNKGDRRCRSRGGERSNSLLFFLSWNLPLLSYKTIWGKLGNSLARHAGLQCRDELHFCKREHMDAEMSTTCFHRFSHPSFNTQTGRAQGRDTYRHRGRASPRGPAEAPSRKLDAAGAGPTWRCAPRATASGTGREAQRPDAAAPTAWRSEDPRNVPLPRGEPICSRAAPKLRRRALLRDRTKTRPPARAPAPSLPRMPRTPRSLEPSADTLEHGRCSRQPRPCPPRPARPDRWPPLALELPANGESVEAAA